MFPAGNGMRLLLRTPSHPTVPTVCRRGHLPITSHSLSLQPWKHGASISPILHRKKLRLRVQSLAQGKEDNNT